MVILGNGLVTADGQSWRNQRYLLAHHLREDILEKIPLMALKAVKRLMVKLDRIKAEGGVVEMAEEFRYVYRSICKISLLLIQQNYITLCSITLIADILPFK